MQVRSVRGSVCLPANLPECAEVEVVGIDAATIVARWDGLIWTVPHGCVEPGYDRLREPRRPESHRPGAASEGQPLADGADVGDGI